MSGVAVLRPDSVAGRYCLEVLEHVRIPYHVVAQLDGQPAVLVAPEPPARRAVTGIEPWVRAGGSLLLCGGPGPLAELAGVAPLIERVTEGRVVVRDEVNWLPVPSGPLRSLGGVRMQPSSGTSVFAEWEDGGAAVTVRQVGRGFVIVLGSDVFGSIMRIQQGWPVHTDAVAPADGTAPVDDGILKVDDGLALSYAEDRSMPGGRTLPEGFVHHPLPERSAPIFHRAQADQWRELFLHCLWWSAERAGSAVPWLYYWPDGLPAVGHVSHDSDGNHDEDALAALRAFAAAGLTVTWCHCHPGGYSATVLAAITSAGHEHALHFNAMGDTERDHWGRRYLAAQHAWVRSLTGQAEVVTNKNHYLRWEGGVEFYRWCEELGIRVEQSRGGTKQGNSGFGFGTCHLARPIATDGTFIDLLMLPLHTLDLVFFAHASIRDVILDEVLARHGVAHFLFHGANLTGRPEVGEAVVDLARAGRDRGMRWWTGEQLGTWEHARRGVDLAIRAKGTGWTVTVHATATVPGASILVALPGLDAAMRVKVEGAAAAVVQRHGRAFVQLDADLPTGSTEITFSLISTSVRELGYPG